jgi:hypothetical protein
MSPIVTEAPRHSGQPTNESPIHILYQSDPEISQSSRPHVSLAIAGVLVSTWLLGALYNRARQPVNLQMAPPDHAQYEWVGYHKTSPSHRDKSGTFIKI